MIQGRAQSIGAAMLVEREHLLPLAEEGFDLASLHFERHGKHEGTRAMIDILLLGREHGPTRVRQAVEEALE
ncbi:MAG: hypothetical protein AAB225_21425 [Acidobacteriota bacterium]